MKFRNKPIQDCWDAAHAILKATRKQLERGLELHRQSLVWDSYGFAPFSAPDPVKLNAAIEEGASPTEITDLIESMGMTRCVDDEVQRREYLDAWEASGVNCIFQNAGEESQAVKHLIKRLANFTHVVDQMPDFYRRAVRPDDVLAAWREGRRCLYFSCNAVPMAEEWISARAELAFVEYFHRLGARMMHLTYNRRNMIGDGCAEPADAGLSDFGRQAIAEMNRVGVIVDVAHSGQRTSLEAAKASSRPMVASHSACMALNRHVRCKTDEVIRAIADTGGYVGICCVGAFLGRSQDLNALLDHVDHIARRFGTDHVAIGTDRMHISRHSDAAWRKVMKTQKQRPRWEFFWPPNDPLLRGTKATPRQTASLAWTNWPLFTVGLVKRGYKDEDIQKIIGGNVLRVVQANT